MEVLFADERLARLFSSRKKLERKYGTDNAKCIQDRLQNLYFASDLEVMRTLPGQTHELKGNRAGTFAIRLKHGYSLVIWPAENPPPRKPDGGVDWREIREVVIVEVIDYHA